MYSYPYRRKGRNSYIKQMHAICLVIGCPGKFAGAFYYSINYLRNKIAYIQIVPSLHVYLQMQSKIIQDILCCFAHYGISWLSYIKRGKLHRCGLDWQNLLIPKVYELLLGVGYLSFIIFNKYSFAANTAISYAFKSFPVLIIKISHSDINARSHCNASSNSAKFETSPFSIT